MLEESTTFSQNLIKMLIKMHKTFFEAKTARSPDYARALKKAAKKIKGDYLFFDSNDKLYNKAISLKYSKQKKPKPSIKPKVKRKIKRCKCGN